MKGIDFYPDYSGTGLKTYDMEYDIKYCEK